MREKKFNIKIHSSNENEDKFITRLLSKFNEDDRGNFQFVTNQSDTGHFHIVMFHLDQNNAVNNVLETIKALKEKGNSSNILLVPLGNGIDRKTLKDFYNRQEIGDIKRTDKDMEICDAIYSCYNLVPENDNHLNKKSQEIANVNQPNSNNDANKKPSNFFNDLDSYHRRRQSNLNEHYFGARFFSYGEHKIAISRKTKLDTAERAMEQLNKEGVLNFERFDKKQLTALMDGQLGKLMEKYGQTQSIKEQLNKLKESQNNPESKTQFKPA